MVRFWVGLMAALAFAGCATHRSPDACPTPPEGTSCVSTGACPDGFACVGSGLCAPRCTECTCSNGRECESLPLHCCPGQACPMFEDGYCVVPGSAWFDAGALPPDTYACTGPTGCVQVESTCVSNWSQLPSQLTLPWSGGPICDGLLMLNKQEAETAERYYFLADSGALLASVTYGTTNGPTAQCNEGLTTFTVPDCTLDAGPNDAGPPTCAGPATCAFDPGSGCQISTWSDVRALPCGWQPGPGPVTAGSCGGYDVLNIVSADTGSMSFFDPDSGALVAVVNSSTAGTTLLCNTPSNTFSVPACSVTDPLPSCDGG